MTTSIAPGDSRIAGVTAARRMRARMRMVARDEKLRKRRQPHLFILVPLLCLGADYAMSPFLFHSRQVKSSLGYGALLDDSNAVFHLGRWNGHLIDVSFDDINSPDYLAHTAGSETALLICHFVSAGRSAVVSWYGGLGQSVGRRIETSAGSLVGNFRDFMEKDLPTRTRGVAHKFADDSDDTFKSSLPFTHLFVIPCVRTSDNQQKQETVARGVEDFFLKAQILGVENVIVPFLTINPRYEDSPMWGFVGAALTALPSSGHSLHVYLSLDRNWDTPSLEEAIASVKDTWDALFNNADQVKRFLVRPHLRLFLLSVAMCLFAASRVTTLTVQSFLVITVSFLAASYGSFAIIDQVAAQWTGGITIAGKSAVVIVLAAVYPWAVHLNVRDVLRPPKAVML